MFLCAHQDIDLALQITCEQLESDTWMTDYHVMTISVS